MLILSVSFDVVVVAINDNDSNNDGNNIIVLINCLTLVGGMSISCTVIICQFYHKIFVTVMLFAEVREYKSKRGRKERKKERKRASFAAALSK